MQESVTDILAAAEANGETAAPDEDLDTAGPTDDEETAGVELAAEDGDTGDVKALKRRNRHTVTLEELRALQARSRARGVAVGKAKAKQVVQKDKLPPGMVPNNDGTKRLVERWAAKKERWRARQEGHYYSTFEIACNVVGNMKGNCAVIIPKGEYVCFDRAVGDDMRYFNLHPAKVTTNWTNLQRPSKNAYNEQDFLIKSLTMQEGGLRIRYEQSDIAQAQNADAHIDVLSGKTWLWDDMGAFLPKEIFHDFSGENLLYRALRRTAVLYFNWDKRRVGGNETSRKILIDHLRNVPDAKVKTLARTSGGASVLSVPDGYIFTDNPEKSDEGEFTAHIHVEEDIAFPIKPIDIGVGSPSKPAQIGLYVQLSLNGVSFEHEGRNRL